MLSRKLLHILLVIVVFSLVFLGIFLSRSYNCLQVAKGIEMSFRHANVEQKGHMEDNLPCKPVYGRVAFFVPYLPDSYEKQYGLGLAQDSLKCYIKMTNYTLFLVDLKNDPEVIKQCGETQVFYRRHCAAAVYLQKTDWLVSLDADTGIVNPHHCIEKWIDGRVDLIFYERFFNWEISADHYIARNTPFAHRFLLRLANWQWERTPNWSGADNGALQLELLRTVMPWAVDEQAVCHKAWLASHDYSSYVPFIVCVKVHLGSHRLWPGQVKVLKRGHAWVRDGFLLTEDHFCDADFMFHNWKPNQIDSKIWPSPFTGRLNVTQCGPQFQAWPWRDGFHLSTRRIKEMLAAYDKRARAKFPKVASMLPFLTEGDVADCWPDCSLP